MPPSTPPGRPLTPPPSTIQDESGFSAPLDIEHVSNFLSSAPNATIAIGLEGLVTQDAVDSAVESALIAVDIAFIPRDNEAPFTPLALSHGSWLPEEPPVPCSMDSWLRSVMPETHPMPKTSYAMSQFLQQNQAMSFKHASASGSLSASVAGTPEPGATSKASMTTKGGRTKSVTSLAGHLVGLESDRSSILNSPDLLKKQEDRLRDELQVRRQQAQAAAQLEAEDAAEKARIAQLAKDLRGKDYSYDHKGQVTVLEGPGKESKDQELPYRLTLPQPPEIEAQVGGRGSPTRMRKINPSPTPNPAKGSRASQAAEKERKLAADYKESKPTSQPSALETMKPNAGVMLRQGGQSKAGPVGTRSIDGVTKDELARMKVRQAMSTPLDNSSLLPTGPKSFTLSKPQLTTPKAALPSDDTFSSGLIASFADAPSAFLDATVKASVPKPAISKNNLSSMDTINAMLLNSSDWGSSGGVGAASSGAPMMTPIQAKVPPLTKIMPRDRLPPVALTASGKMSKI